MEETATQCLRQSSLGSLEPKGRTNQASYERNARKKKLRLPWKQRIIWGDFSDTHFTSIPARSPQCLRLESLWDVTDTHPNGQACIPTSQCAPSMAGQHGNAESYHHSFSPWRVQSTARRAPWEIIYYQEPNTQHLRPTPFAHSSSQLRPGSQLNEKRTLKVIAAKCLRALNCQCACTQHVNIKEVNPTFGLCSSKHQKLNFTQFHYSDHFSYSKNISEKTSFY